MNKLFLVPSLLIICCGSSEKADNDKTVVDYSRIVSDSTDYDSNYDYGFDEPVDFDEDYKLVLEFGDENLPDEYLIANPVDVSVTHSGDIIVSDEYKMKIFDKNGNPKQIIGSSGQGPEEFSSFPIVYISETGYISVTHGAYYSTLTPDYEFIEKKNIFTGNILKKAYEGLNRTHGQLHYMNTFGPSEKVFVIRVRTINLNESVYVIIYQNGDELKTINCLTNENDNWPVSQVCNVVMSFLNKKRIVYGKNYEFKTLKNSQCELSLFIQGFSDSVKKEMKITYNPVPLPEDLFTAVKMASRRVTKKREKQWLSKATKILKKLKYRPHVHFILTDGDFIFLVSRYQNSDNYLPIEVYNTLTGKLINEFSIPVYPRMITHGYLYGFNDYYSEGTLPKVYKYRLHPRLYGK
jgi:hypothetical protein